MMTTNEKPLILLVDDMPANLHVLVAALRDDHRIKTATSGTTALDLAERDDRPQLILLDVVMPGMSGLEVLRRLRENPETRDIPVIFITADVSEQSQLEGLDLGADDYITKPVVAAVLRVRVRNLLQRKRTEARLRLAAHVFEYGGEAILITDCDNCIVEVNPAFTRLTGYTSEEICGQNPKILSAGHATAEEYQRMWHAIREQGFWQGEMWDRRKNGEIYPKLLTISVVRNAQGEIDFHIGSFTDLSEQKAVEEKIRYVAHHDALTGLPNRLHLQISLEQVIATAKRENQEVALMFIDLDRFKIINDTLGHNIGDCLLVEVAQRLRECVRESDLLARLGGDEFVLALAGDDVVNAAAQVAEKILGNLSQTYHIGGQVLHSSTSIGISLYPHDGDNIETLMKNADASMYHAKAMGRNNFQFFSPEMNRFSNERLLLENSLHRALAQGEFTVHYQPQADIASGRLVGAEALIRWHHPERGMVSPLQFIPLAEENGMILPIGTWVLREVCRQIKVWREVGLTDLRFAVNLSPRQFHQENLVGNIIDILREFDVPASALELEITEGSVMENPDAAVSLLNQLNQHGLSIAIDDFGTGYSSLGYLKRFPVSKLKIDRSFVMDIPGDPDDSAIAIAVIQLARSLGLKTVAEGVETTVQRQFLSDQGCDMLQGYWYSKPLDAATFEAFALHAAR
ncbi:response regulator receiver modulated diguanylate cyclase/phosphodiesterase with PAS/PAC sensor(S) [Sulfuricella denitrificans skB26]|uniref:Response regulator receiver modulated diguanylate cyclase/phosphodiesterase with PAS/PAC sensor(S) n=1 Tax=Sulfuricella denitrificans (strain DSM 22764 / NBRC 105220 / skB26) TaxID=1163617 RepID=S6AHR6_SULDS|nr:EAL domain-containing protein [Sulfuricella denitrificans]BAN34069.1 response regulator receiver modulated diguanylate cyclase/phosphodiesterase with PAS/PAC sensor(S) [Sulfuricella denitrificans skB26]